MLLKCSIAYFRWSELVSLVDKEIEAKPWFSSEDPSGLQKWVIW